MSRLLAGIPGFVPVGELGFLWDRAIQGNLPCGCGAPFDECPFWQAVGQAAFWQAGEWHETRTTSGLTAIIVEGERLNPHQYALLENEAGESFASKPTDEQSA